MTKTFFYLERPQILCWFILHKKKLNKCQIFDEKDGLTLLNKKTQFCVLHKEML